MHGKWQCKYRIKLKYLKYLLAYLEKTEEEHEAFVTVVMFDVFRRFQEYKNGECFERTITGVQ